MNIEPGEVEAPASLVDLFPTVLDVLGVDRAGAALDGTSLLGIPRDGSHQARFIFADYQQEREALSCVRLNNFKWVANLDSDKRTLFDMDKPLTDKGERGRKVWNGPVANRMAKAFATYVKAADETNIDLSSDFEVDVEEALKDLRALGYVQ